MRMVGVGCALIGALALGATGCIKQMILDGQIEATRKASAAIDSLADYDVARGIAFAGLGQIEGMHYLAPDNDDALFMLTRSWAGTAFGFIEDEMEQVEDSSGIDSPLYKYQQARARAAYERAIHYGTELLGKKQAGFAQARRNDDTIKAWLGHFTDPDDAAILFWTGNAWLGKTNIAKEEPEVVADLFVGVAMVERAVQLDETYQHGIGHVALGAYHARTALAELDESKKEFDRALALSGGKLLMAQFQYATKYYCMKGDKPNYEKLLNEVLQSGDPLPEARLTNVIAKRRAARYLGHRRMQALCGF